jgi:basic membrane protein A
MIQPRRLFFIPFVALALLAGACSDDSSESGSSDGGGSDDPLKVAFVYVGPTGDAGWTKRHDDGRKAIEEAFGDQVETTFIESVPEGQDAERVFEDLARDGNDIIFGTSFGYGDPMLAVAAENPDVCFQHASGATTADNMGTYFGAAEEARYLSGIAAGHATESGQIGYVAAFPIPEVIRGINAFTLGAQTVNPDATVSVVWTSTWFGPEVEKQAAESLISAGADVVSMHQDTPATGEAAADAGAKWVGYQDDMESFAPDAWLTGAMWDWGPHYIDVVQSVLDGECPTDQYYGNMADGLVLLAPYGSSVDDAVQAEVDGVRDSIIDGTFVVFTGPIVDQSGAEVVAAGEVVSFDDQQSMSYFVQGVQGEIPESDG